MGQLTIDVKSLEDRRVDRKWHVLQPKPTLSKKKIDEEKKLGKLELAIRWKHNPDRVIQLPEAFHQDDLLDQPANYVQICLVRARKLKVMDKSLFKKGGSSDPLVVFALVVSSLFFVFALAVTFSIRQTVFECDSCAF